MAGGGDRIEFETFPERTLREAEDALERLLASGEIGGEHATHDDLARARVPASAGPAFLALARRFRSLTLTMAEVRIDLHAGAAIDDPLGGWRLGADPAEIDLRLAVPHEAQDDGDAAVARSDVVYDASFRHSGSEPIVLHSTIVHFLVRAAAGDRA